MFPEYGDFYESPHAFTNIEKSEDAIDALRERKVEEFMKKNVQTIKQDDPIMKAGGLMLAHHVHQLPVVEDGQYLGMISREDVFSAILKSHLGF
jgi:CBS domain-containing protein